MLSFAKGMAFRSYLHGCLTNLIINGLSKGTSLPITLAQTHINKSHTSRYDTKAVGVALFPPPSLHPGFASSIDGSRLQQTELDSNP